MDPGSSKMREYTFRGLIKEARELLVTLYGSYEQYLRASDYESRFELEDACVLYSRSVEYPVCAIQALKMLHQYDGEKGDEALSALHFYLQARIAGKVEGTCNTCLISPYGTGAQKRKSQTF